jgi:2-oxoglutarate ferredoxin oxidoreductase subunit alpha
LAPGDHTQAFELTWKAFNLADQIQTPVIVLGDSYLSDNRKTSEPFDNDAVHIDRGSLVLDGSVNAYRRYSVTESGVSERAIPGVVGATQIVNSYEHDEFGYGAQGETAENRLAQNEKRMRKLELARTLVPPPVVHGDQNAEVSIICFGTTVMPVREAIGWLAAEGHSVCAMQIVTVWPFPADEVRDFLEHATYSLVIEGNATGQLEGLVREQCLVAPDARLRRSDGRPISPELVYAAAKEHLNEPVRLTTAGAIDSVEDV